MIDLPTRRIGQIKILAVVSPTLTHILMMRLRVNAEDEVIEDEITSWDDGGLKKAPSTQKVGWNDEDVATCMASLTDDDIVVLASMGAGLLDSVANKVLVERGMDQLPNSSWLREELVEVGDSVVREVIVRLAEKVIETPQHLMHLLRKSAWGEMHRYLAEDLPTFGPSHSTIKRNREDLELPKRRTYDSHESHQDDEPAGIVVSSAKRNLYRHQSEDHWEAPKPEGYWEAVETLVDGALEHAGELLPVVRAVLDGQCKNVGEVEQLAGRIFPGSGADRRKTGRAALRNLADRIAVWDSRYFEAFEFFAEFAGKEDVERIRERRRVPRRVKERKAA